MNARQLRRQKYIRKGRCPECAGRNPVREGAKCCTDCARRRALRDQARKPGHVSGQARINFCLSVWDVRVGDATAGIAAATQQAERDLRAAS